MKLGVFIPIGNNGWLISTTSPQYMPSFDLNRTVVEIAERFGFEFALSMIKLRGFGGPSQYWDHNLESFTLMAGLAAVTSRIQLFASVAVLTVPPAFAARNQEFFAQYNAGTLDPVAYLEFALGNLARFKRSELDAMHRRFMEEVITPALMPEARA